MTSIAEVMRSVRPMCRPRDAWSMELKPWPVEFARKKRGDGYPQCEEGRIDLTAHGVHIVSRYDPVPAPSLPLPAEAWDAGSVVQESEMESQIAVLRQHLATPA